MDQNNPNSHVQKDRGENSSSSVDALPTFCAASAVLLNKSRREMRMESVWSLQTLATLNTVWRVSGAVRHGVDELRTQ
jgi:hypothetical protein